MLWLLTIMPLVLTVAASPVVVRESPITLPLAKRYNFRAGITIPEIDKARVDALQEYSRKKARGSDGAFPVFATNAVVTYTLPVSGMGTVLSCITLTILYRLRLVCPQLSVCFKSILYILLCLTLEQILFS